MAKHGSEDVRAGGDSGPDSIESGIREKVREVIQTIVNEELKAALGAGVSTRVEGRRGYRHGTRARTVTTEGALSGVASGQAVASNFAPMSTTSLQWCGSFLYGPAHRRGATIKPRRWRRTARILGSVGVRSADGLSRLESLQVEALAAGRRWPAGDQVFVPLLTPW